MRPASTRATGGGSAPHQGFADRLLLLDWNMPMMNGLELVKHLRAIEEYARLPIIMVTSEAAKYSVIEAVKAGVNDYIINRYPRGACWKK